MPRKGADASSADDTDLDAPDASLDDLMDQVQDLPEDWQEFVLGRIEAQKVAARKRSDDDRKTLDEVFDKSTLLVLYKYISNGHLETLDYPVSTGKEANVFHATTPQGRSVAVKIFRTNTATFRSFMTYIAGDPRFGHVKPNRRHIVYVWAQKEYKNLQRYAEAGVRVPAPIAWRENVLLMDFIGSDRTPAPRLKDAPFDDPATGYEELVRQYRLGAEGAQLVHGDFSEFNILNLDGTPVVIDVAQAVLATHPMAGDLLARDAKNLSAYFRKQGVKVTAEETLARIAPPKKAREPMDREVR